MEVISKAAAEDGLVVPIATVPVNKGEAIGAFKFIAVTFAAMLAVFDAIFVFKVVSSVKLAFKLILFDKLLVSAIFNFFAIAESVSVLMFVTVPDNWFKLAAIVSV